MSISKAILAYALSKGQGINFSNTSLSTFERTIYSQYLFKKSFIKQACFFGKEKKAFTVKATVGPLYHLTSRLMTVRDFRSIEERVLQVLFQLGVIYLIVKISSYKIASIEAL